MKKQRFSKLSGYELTGAVGGVYLALIKHLEHRTSLDIANIFIKHIDVTIPQYPYAEVIGGSLLSAALVSDILVRTYKGSGALESCYSQLKKIPKHISMPKNISII